MKHSVEKREEQLLRSIPDIVGYKTLLYIGANAKRMEMLRLFTERSFVVDILEAWEPNVRELESWNEEKRLVRRVILGDVRNFAAERAYDIVMWWHGPEHVGKDELGLILRKLEAASRHLVVLAAPSGMSPQGAAYGNPHERHVATLYGRDFRDFNYRINILGKTDREGSNLLAWKRVT